MNAERLDEIAAAFRDAQCLFTALRLGLFDLLAERALEAPEIASRLEADSRAVRILCDALAALGLLDKREGTYTDSDVAKDVLVASSPEAKVDRYLLSARQYARWGRLYDVVKEGTPVPKEQDDPRFGDNPRAFAAAMADVGRASADKLLAAVDLTAARRVLDLGGGPGVYAIAMAARYPDLQAFIFDRSETAEVARENIASAGLEERVATLAGDAFADDLGGPYDFALLSNILHIYGADQNRRLVARCADALAPGGRLCVKDFILDGDRITPAGGTLFAVNMLVNTETGDCFTLDELDRWLTAAGLEPESLTDLTPHSRIRLARKPLV